MVQYFIKKRDFPEFVESLVRSNTIIAPKEKDGILVFDRVGSHKEIRLDYVNTVYPPKNFFFKYPEAMFEYGKKGVNPKYETGKQILFGVRPCDVHGLLVLDKLFLDERPDPYYALKRKNTRILALNCRKPGENCFCTSLGTDTLTEGYDLLFTEIKGGFVVEVGSKEGERLVGKLFVEWDEKPEVKLNCVKSISEGKLEKLSSSFEHPVWKREAERCLSCCACTISCPTCACFDVLDEPEFNLKEGVRARKDISCQIKDFTQVAGGHVFRDERYRRVRQRVYHKLNYFKETFGVHMCVGCGRCTSNCPTDIDLTEMVNQL